MSHRIIFGYQNTKEQGEDFVLTPYIILPYANKKDYIIVGIGVGIFFYAISIVWVFSKYKLSVKMFSFRNMTVYKINNSNKNRS